MSTAAVIVTYNRKELLCENIKMLASQSRKVDLVIIVDNHSSDGTAEYIKNQPFYNESWIHIEAMSENFGGAGGFYYGLKTAYNMGFDFFWLMDDDGKPFNMDTFQNLWIVANKVYMHENKAFLLNSLVTYDGERMSFGFGVDEEELAQMKREGVECIHGKANPFNGTLLTKETVDIVGYPNKDFFIRCDEKDFVLRCRKAGVYIATIVGSVYQHPKPQFTLRRFLLWHVKVNNYTPFQIYYTIRNEVFYLSQGDEKRYLRKCLGLQLMSILLYEKDKGRKVKAFLKALHDGKNGILGKTI